MRAGQRTSGSRIDTKMRDREQSREQGEQVSKMVDTGIAIVGWMRVGEIDRESVTRSMMGRRDGAERWVITYSGRDGMIAFSIRPCYTLCENGCQ